MCNNRKYVDGGGVKANLFATTIDRGSLAVVEVAESSLLTSVPDTGVWHRGSLNTASRYFDVVFSGNCNVDSSDQKLKLNFQSAYKIPSFFAKNSEGKIIFAEPRPMVTISSPKGHNAWLKIDLIKINGQFSNIEKYVCLGIRKHSENEYYDILHANNKSRFVDVMDGDPVELVPLLSSTDVTSKCTLVTSGEQVVLANFGVSGSSLDFSSVYRINTEVQSGQWITEECNAGDGNWSNRGVGVGPANGKDNQLVAVSPSGALVCSSNGIHWTKLPITFQKVDATQITYGNGTWCITNGASGISSAIGVIDYSLRYSTDKCKTWVNSSIPNFSSVGGRSSAFANGTFLVSDSTGAVYLSRDGMLWNRYEKKFSNWARFSSYDGEKWLLGGIDGDTYNNYRSTDGINWTPISSNLHTLSSELWVTACYANGYFYAASVSGDVARSRTGGTWDKVIGFERPIADIIYYKNKLYILDVDANVCHIGFPNP